MTKSHHTITPETMWEPLIFSNRVAVALGSHDGMRLMHELSVKTSLWQVSLKMNMISLHLHPDSQHYGLKVIPEENMNPEGMWKSIIAGREPPYLMTQLPRLDAKMTMGAIEDSRARCR